MQALASDDVIKDAVTGTDGTDGTAGSDDSADASDGLVITVPLSADKVKLEVKLPSKADLAKVDEVLKSYPDITNCLSFQTAKFTPKSAEGTVKMTFPVNSLYNEGTNAVVYEFLYNDDNLVAQDADLEHEDQTVEMVVGKISTTATDKTDGDHTILPSHSATIVDHVEYTNLIPGKEYTVSGVLMDKETGKELVVGDSKVTAEKAFTPNKADGTVDLEFTFDASELGDHDLVVFETLYKDGIEVADHKDIDDEGQTVHVDSPDVPDAPENPAPSDETEVTGGSYSKTGVDLAWVWALVAGLVVVGGGAGAYAWRQRKLAQAEAANGETTDGGSDE